jgi:hypothetical protein
MDRRNLNFGVNSGILNAVQNALRLFSPGVMQWQFPTIGLFRAAAYLMTVSTPDPTLCNNYWLSAKRAKATSAVADSRIVDPSMSAIRLVDQYE